MSVSTTPTTTAQDDESVVTLKCYYYQTKYYKERIEESWKFERGTLSFIHSKSNVNLQDEDYKPEIMLTNKKGVILIIIKKFSERVIHDPFYLHVEADGSAYVIRLKGFEQVQQIIDHLGEYTGITNYRMNDLKCRHLWSKLALIDGQVKLSTEIYEIFKQMELRKPIDNFETIKIYVELGTKFHFETGPFARNLVNKSADDVDYIITFEGLRHFFCLSMKEFGVIIVGAKDILDVHGFTSFLLSRNPDIKFHEIKFKSLTQ